MSIYFVGIVKPDSQQYEWKPSQIFQGGQYSHGYTFLLRPPGHCSKGNTDLYRQVTALPRQIYLLSYFYGNNFSQFNNNCDVAALSRWPY